MRLSRPRSADADEVTSRRRGADVHGSREPTVPGVDRLAVLDRAGQARILGSLQRHLGNAAVQRMLATGASVVSVQRDRVFVDKHPTLSWKDFKGKAPPLNAFDAETAFGRTGLAWKAKATKQGPDWDAEATIDTRSLNLRAFVDRGRSWVRKGKKSGDLLRHEQGHADIANVMTEKGEAAVRAVAPGAVGNGTARNAKQAVKDAVTQLQATAPFVKLASTDTVAARAQHEYDEDPVIGTAHGTRAAEQLKWESDIAAGLPGYPIP